MHWIVGAVMHATVLGIVAFFLLFAASKAEGLVALLGRLLGYWVLLVAILSLVCGIYGGVTGKPGDVPGMGWMHEHGPGWMHHWGPPPGGPTPPPPAAAAPAAPAPAPAKP